MGSRSATEGRRAARLAFACAALGFGTLAAADNSSAHFALGAAYESNAPRAERSEDVRHDFSQTARMAFSRSRLLGEDGGLNFSADLAYENRRYAALNNATAGVELAYRWQPVRGYLSPWYEISASAQVLRFANSAIRDGERASLIASAGRNLTDRIEVKAGAGLEKRWAAAEHVYDLDWRVAFADLTYQIGKASAYVHVRRIWGDQVFSVQPAGGGAYDAKAVADDPSFGEEFYAYRLGAVATVAQLGFLAPLDESNSVSLSLSRYSAAADGGHRYVDSLLGATLVHRFD